jgi:4-amino-4-deoxy-L-arabinose transferase-like glycosyltransferase
MTERRTLALPVFCLVALAHAGLYIWYQQPDWDTSWTDQAGYERLGAALATTGKFTRYPDASDFVPEVIRTPGYPAFVAAVYLVAGVGNHMAVAVAQAGVFAALVLLVYLLARRAAGDRVGLAAAGATALFPPFPYFGALVLTELWTTFVATAAVLLCLRAVQTRTLAGFAWAGVLFSAATLVRPAFVLLPFFLAAGVPLVARPARAPRAIAGWRALAVAAVITLAPWFAYNYINLGDFTLSPAGGIGRGLWEGAWQGRWAGRLQAELITLAGGPAGREELDQMVRARADAAELPAGPMLQYVHEWRDIRAVWDTPTDPAERARARVEADRLYLRAALAQIRADPAGHLWRRMTRGVFVLWAAEVPVRYSDINLMPTLAIRLIWLAQVLLLALAAVGAWRLAHAGRTVEAAVLALPLVYVTLVHLPLLCEARQSLPVKPLVLTLAAIGAQGQRRALPS